MRRFFFWPTLIIAATLIILAGMTVIYRYDLDIRSPAGSVSLTDGAG